MQDVFHQQYVTYPFRCITFQPVSTKGEKSQFGPLGFGRALATKTRYAWGEVGRNKSQMHSQINYSCSAVCLYILSMKTNDASHKRSFASPGVSVGHRDQTYTMMQCSIPSGNKLVNGALPQHWPFVWALQACGWVATVWDSFVQDFRLELRFELRGLGERRCLSAISGGVVCWKWHLFQEILGRQYCAQVPRLSLVAVTGLPSITVFWASQGQHKKFQECKLPGLGQDGIAESGLLGGSDRSQSPRGYHVVCWEICIDSKQG